MAAVLYIAITALILIAVLYKKAQKKIEAFLKREERELEDKILSNNRKIRNLKEEERELEEEIKKIKMVLEKLERYKN